MSWKILPRWFYDLTLGLRQAGAFHDLLNLPPSAARVQHWYNKTSQPFEYSIDGNSALNKKTIQCHHCSAFARVGKPLSWYYSAQITEGPYQIL